MKVDHLLYMSMVCLVWAQVNGAPSPTNGSYYLVHTYTEDTIRRETACAGRCSYEYSLQCSVGQKIGIRELEYGAKKVSSTCPDQPEQCQVNYNDCCRYYGGDCLMSFSDAKAYQVYQNCSAMPQCGKFAAEAIDMQSRCMFRKTSNYVATSYKCVDDSSFLDVCSNDIRHGKTVKLIYRGNTQNKTTSSQTELCNCLVSTSNCKSLSRLRIKTVDIRLQQQDNIRSCHTHSKFCITDTMGHRNFSCKTNHMYRGYSDLYYSQPNNPYARISLYNRPGQFPSFFWLEISATLEDVDVVVSCGKANDNRTLCGDAELLPSTKSHGGRNPRPTPANYTTNTTIPWWITSRPTTPSDQNCYISSNTCLNGGSCTYSSGYYGYYRCVCRYGYTGKRCETAVRTTTTVLPTVITNIDRNCSSNHTCLNGGTCHNGVCYCVPGYSGRFCDMIVMTTTSPLCQCKFGNCLPDPKHNYLPRCSCFKGYTGRNCETELPNVTGGGKWCNPINPCHNGAKCIGDDFDYDCKCDPKKYYGSHCEREYVTCNYGSSCQNGGTCRRYRYGSISKYNYRGLCVCKTGYKGDFCQKEIDAIPRWVEIFSENQRWSGNYSYNKFMIPFQLEIEALTKDVLMATFSDQDTKTVMKGYSLDDIYITFNVSRLIKPSHRIPSDFELSGQFMKRSKKNIWEYKGKVSRPDNAIFGTFSLSSSKEKAVRRSQKQVAIPIGVGTSVSVLFVVAVVIVVIFLVRKGVLSREPRAFSPKDSLTVNRVLIPLESD